MFNSFLLVYQRVFHMVHMVILFVNCRLEVWANDLIVGYKAWYFKRWWTGFFCIPVCSWLNWKLAKNGQKSPVLMNSQLRCNSVESKSMKSKFLAGLISILVVWLQVCQNFPESRFQVVFYNMSHFLEKNTSNVRKWTPNCRRLPPGNSA